MNFLELTISWYDGEIVEARLKLLPGAFVVDHFSKESAERYHQTIEEVIK